jgi:hypothetical protein
MYKPLYDAGIHASVIGKDGKINTWCLEGIIYKHNVQR